MLNAISNYLQNLPFPQQPQATAAEVGKANAVDKKDGAEDISNLDAYAPSTRVLLLGAVATDFNVRSLSGEQVNGLQHQVQQYGLLNGRDLDAFSLLNTAHQLSDDNKELDAVSYLDKAVQDFDHKNTPYSERQQILRLHRLVHNLDSAHQALNARLN